MGKIFLLKTTSRGGEDAPSSEIRPAADPKGPSFVFSEYPILTDSITFLKVPSAPHHINFEGEHTPKKRNFLVKNFQKVSKNAFFWPVFSKFFLRRRKFGYNEVFIVIQQSSENQLVDLIKSRQNF